VKYKLKNIVTKPVNQDENGILVEIELEIFCRVFEEKTINIIQDMYSPSRNIVFEENKVNTMVNLKSTSEVINVREKVRLEDGEYLRVLDVNVSPVVSETKISNGRVRYTGDLNLRFILANNEENDSIIFNSAVPFDFSKEIENLTENSQLESEITPIFREFVQDNLDINVKIDLRVDINSYNLETVNVIDNIEETDLVQDNPYSMVIYFVKRGDTLWKIAKKYQSTIGDIVRVNDIENPDSIDVGMKLFIPKFSKV